MVKVRLRPSNIYLHYKLPYSVEPRPLLAFRHRDQLLCKRIEDGRGDYEVVRWIRLVTTKHLQCLRQSGLVDGVLARNRHLKHLVWLSGTTNRTMGRDLGFALKLREDSMNDSAFFCHKISQFPITTCNLPEQVHRQLENWTHVAERTCRCRTF